MGTEKNMVAPMGVGGVQHLIERAYREGSELQYARELVKNAIEGGATRIELGPEWRAVEKEGVYRLMVADNGVGMAPDQMEKFLNTFGGGGKPIGDAHENFGVGAKTSLLPWNHHGTVVLSWTPSDPTGSMIWLARDSGSGEYGARKFKTDEGYEVVVTPFGEFADVKPDWITDHGTVVICLGNSGKEDTFLGKDGQGDIKGLSAYLNKRMWKFGPGVEVYVQELRSQKKADWPRSLEEARASSPANPGDIDRRYNRRQINGAKYYIEIPSKQGSLAAHGAVNLSDGTAIEWYLWGGPRPEVHSYAHKNGYIAALYKGELYDTQQHFSNFRSFGITQKDVRDNLTLIAIPPSAGKGSFGVYPDTARNSLKIQGTKMAGEPLPWSTWAEEFAAKLPHAIVEAIAKAGPKDAAGTITDPTWKDRLIDRFGRRWSTTRYIPDAKGEVSADAVSADASSGPGGGKGGSGQGGGSKGGGVAPAGDGAPKAAIKGTPPCAVKATSKKAKGGVPDYKWTDETEVEAGYAAVWSPHDAGFPSGNGGVLINRQFPAFLEVKKYWQDQYPDYQVERVAKTIEEAYGEVLVARIAHSEMLRSDPRWGTKKVEEELRSPAALTMAVLGLFAEEALIKGRLAQRLGKGKAAHLKAAA